MNFIKNLLTKKEEPIKNYQDFWNWFQKNEKAFFKVIKNEGNIEKEFFNVLTPKLSELKDGYYVLTGMKDEHTAELIFTADGIIENIIYMEEMVAQAPKIDGWKFTALKPEVDIEDLVISMANYTFDKNNLFFYSNNYDQYPDLIDITVVHTDLNEKNEEQISNGTYIFLDNFLGELDLVNTIDNLSIIGMEKVEQELVPISKLKDFLTWRQKEFIEKYDGVRYNTEKDVHSILEAEYDNGNKLIAVINTEVLNWDRKSSHPWIAVINFTYNGAEHNGMPNEQDFQRLQELEENLRHELTDQEGYIYIGRQSSNNLRIVYFACKDFRKPSKLFYNLQQEQANAYNISYNVYKDKYWQSFDRFNPKLQTL